MKNSLLSYHKFTGLFKKNIQSFIMCHFCGSSNIWRCVILFDIARWTVYIYTVSEYNIYLYLYGVGVQLQVGLVFLHVPKSQTNSFFSYSEILYAYVLHISFFQSLYRIHLDSTNKKIALTGNATYNGTLVKEQILHDFNAVSSTRYIHC